MTSPPLVLSPNLFAARRLHLYTDASASSRENLLGGILFLDNVTPAFSTSVPPYWVRFASSMLNPIVVYEGVAILTALSTFQERLLGRRVIVHVDNKAIHDSLISGNVKGNDEVSSLAGRIIKQFQMLHCWPYFVYVNTKFNISDCLTRSDLKKLCVDEFSLSVEETTVPL